MIAHYGSVRPAGVSDYAVRVAPRRGEPMAVLRGRVFTVPRETDRYVLPPAAAEVYGRVAWTRGAEAAGAGNVAIGAPARSVCVRSVVIHDESQPGVLRTSVLIVFEHRIDPRDRARAVAHRADDGVGEDLSVAMEADAHTSGFCARASQTVGLDLVALARTDGALPCIPTNGIVWNKCVGVRAFGRARDGMRTGAIAARSPMRCSG